MHLTHPQSPKAPSLTAAIRRLANEGLQEPLSPINTTDDPANPARLPQSWTNQTHRQEQKTSWMNQTHPQEPKTPSLTVEIRLLANADLQEPLSPIKITDDTTQTTQRIKCGCLTDGHIKHIVDITKGTIESWQHNP